MRKPLLFLLLFSLFSTLAFCEVDTERTYRLYNGRYWNNVLVKYGMEHGFVLGFIDTWEVRRKIENAKRGSLTGQDLLALNLSGNTFTTLELAKMVTSIYSESENLNLPIGWVILSCFAIMRGDTDRATVLRAFRERLSEIEMVHPGKIIPNNLFNPLDLIFELKKRARDGNG